MSSPGSGPLVEMLTGSSMLTLPWLSASLTLQDRPAALQPQEHRPCPFCTLQEAQRGPGGENYSEGTQGHSYTAMQFTLQIQNSNLPGAHRLQHGSSGNTSCKPTGKKL